MATDSNYYVPEESRLPVLGALALGLMALGAGLLLNDGTSGILWTGTVLLVAVMYIWFRTVIRENIAGMNSDQLKRSYVWGMSWFIFSEVMFFAVFFGALFYIRTLALPWLGGEGDKSDMIHLESSMKSTVGNSLGSPPIRSERVPHLCTLLLMGSYSTPLVPYVNNRSEPQFSTREMSR